MKELATDPVLNFRTVGLAITLRCNYTCAHCINDSGPHQGDQIGLEEALNIIACISQESNNICFTGGESFLYRDMLFNCIRAAKEMGMIVSLVTNGFWATSRDVAKKTLVELEESGLTGICISMDRFHLPFGKAENALHAARLCGEMKLKHVVRVCSTASDDFADDFINPKKWPGINFQRVPVLRMGRAATLPVELFRTKREIPNQTCDTALAPIVLPNGKVQACCGPGVEFNDSNPLNLGNWREESLALILKRARRNPLVAALHNIGPKGIISLLDKVDSSAIAPRRNLYTGICELCVDMCNNPGTVNSMASVFEQPRVKLQLIAGQVYQQCYTFLGQNNFLDLPEFAS